MGVGFERTIGYERCVAEIITPPGHRSRRDNGPRWSTYMKLDAFSQHRRLIHRAPIPHDRTESLVGSVDLSYRSPDATRLSGFRLCALQEHRGSQRDSCGTRRFVVPDLVAGDYGSRQDRYHASPSPGHYSVMAVSLMATATSDID